MNGVGLESIFLSAHTLKPILQAWHLFALMRHINTSFSASHGSNSSLSIFRTISVSNTWADHVNKKVVNWELDSAQWGTNSHGFILCVALWNWDIIWWWFPVQTLNMVRNENEGDNSCPLMCEVRSISYSRKKSCVYYPNFCLYNKLEKEMTLEGGFLKRGDGDHLQDNWDRGDISI